MRIVTGDILESQEQYIAHQCNCVSKGSVGLARAIFDKFPYSNIYEERFNKKFRLRSEQEAVSCLGNIIVKGNGVDQRYVINMLAQFYPGKTGVAGGADKLRLRHFLNCLNKIRIIPGIKSVAFPHKIGCGCAGGDWDQYKALIKQFDDDTDIDVVIYKLKG